MLRPAGATLLNDFSRVKVSGVPTAPSPAAHVPSQRWVGRTLRPIQQTRMSVRSKVRARSLSTARFHGPRDPQTEREFLAADKRRFLEQIKTMQPVSAETSAQPSANRHLSLDVAGSRRTTSCARSGQAHSAVWSLARRRRRGTLLQ